MVEYWKYQTAWDGLLAIAATAAAWLAPNFGAPVLFSVNMESMTFAARAWLGPALTLLGMMSATTAFIFTVVDRAEFAILRRSKSEAQLWRIFAQNLLWLGIAAGYCAIVTFWSGACLELLALLGTFVIAIATISVAKFVWIMRQIISVRIGQATQAQ